MSDDDLPTVTIYLGDSSWHDGTGWYYVIDESPDEGSVGAFDAIGHAEAHAVRDGYRVSNDLLCCAEKYPERRRARLVAIGEKL